MRRRLTSLTLVASLSLAAVACGSNNKQTSSTSAAPSSSAATSSSAASSSQPTPTIPADCPTPATTPEPTFPEGKPEVDLPSAAPTELVITDLIDGDGAVAQVGDTVTLNYVGVRSADGVEFDNSYDRGQPFTVTLGSGTVIQGWEQGLIGIKVGGRRQLDIPSALAYGESERSEVIKANTDLTFVVDALAISPGPPVADPADEPTLDDATAPGVLEWSATDVVQGDRCDIALPGDTVFVQIVVHNGDTGEVVQSTWAEGGNSIQISLDASTLQSLVDGVVGMGVGGRRKIVIPPELGFGAAGNADFGMAETTNLVLLVDLVALA